MLRQQFGEKTIQLVAERDIVTCRDAARRASRVLELSIVDETRIVTATSELARNLIAHAEGHRTITVSLVDADRCGVRVVSRDEGPGIADLDLAMGDGFSSADTLGVGLPGTRRIVDEFSIRSGPQGTVVEVIRWQR